MTGGRPECLDHVIVFHAAGLHGSCRIISNTRKDAICIDRSKKMLPSADPSSFLCLVRALTRVTFLEGDVKLLDQSSNDWLTEYLPHPSTRLSPDCPLSVA